MLLTPHSAADRTGGRWICVREGCTFAVGAPQITGGSLLDPVEPVVRYPAQGAMVLPGAGLLGPHGWVLLPPDGTIAAAASRYGLASSAERILGRPLAPELLPTRRVAGTALSLVSEWSAENYGHFLIDGLGRLELAEAAGWGADRVDHVVLPAFETANARRALSALGLDGVPSLTLAPGQLLLPDVLVATTFPGVPGKPHPATVAYLRERLAVPSGEGPRRVFIDRDAPTRRLVNAAAVRSCVQAHGFVVVDPGAHPRGPELVGGADVVIGAHGAALAAILGCRPGSWLLELLPQDHAFAYYHVVARAGGLRYRGLVVQSEQRRAPGVRGPSTSDFRVDIAELERELDDVLCAAPR